ncbi:MAG TPA: ATPase domain-containing protein, partial [Thermoanaerobaculia bacterium]
EKLLAEGGHFEHLYRSPVEMELDEVVRELFRRVRDSKIKRVAIDSLADLKRSSFDPQRYMEYMYALVQWFAVEGITSMMTYEIPHLFEAHSLSEEQISNISDNIVLLRFTQSQPMERTLRIIKTRNSGHDHAERVLKIRSGGISVGDPAAGS